MVNITLKIDRELLEKARRLALEKRTSINAIFRQTLHEFVNRNMERDAVLKGLESFYRRSNAVIGKKYWTRADIHER